MRYESPLATACHAARSILLVDPNHERGSATAARMSNAELGQVEHASDGEQALVRMLRRPRPRAVVVDGDTPEGRRLVRRIRRDGTLDSVSIVVTSSTEGGAFGGSVDMGCNAVIAEPDAELRNAIAVLAVKLATV